MAWSFSVGNMAARSPRTPVAVSPAAADPLLPLARLANDHPSDEASFEWRADGAYKVDVDLNGLLDTSARADAPTGWRDALLALANTPGLPANPPDWGTYGSRTALRIYRPVMQEVAVMPGEDWKLECGIYELTASAATGIQVRVIDTWSGKGWNGSAWVSNGILDSQSTEDTWKDIAEEITADPNRDERSTYQIIFEPIASSYDATTYVYVSANGGSGSPAFYPKASLAALIAHNIPLDATVSVGSHSVTMTAISATVTFSSAFLRTFRLDIAMPGGNQPRPKIGEVWIGNPTTMLRGPMGGITLIEGDAYQNRLEAAQGRMEVLSDQKYPSQAMKLQVKTASEAAYEQWRNVVTRGSRFGAEPILLIPPDQLDGANRVLHGRIGPTISYTLPNAGWRTFEVEFVESPFPGA